MATRSIVTSQPDVPCDVCGRRLLRGEQPDVFLAGGQRRTVCELCAPRASHEGWLREADSHSLSLPPARPRRGRSLLDRLRQQGWPTQPSGPGVRDRSIVRPSAIAALPEDPRETASYDFFDGGPGAAELPAGVVEPEAFDLEQTAGPVPAVAFSDDVGPFPAEGSPGDGDGDAMVQRALEVFNAGEHPRRVAGVARSLGAPSVTVRPRAESGETIAIVVAWELCWYRYEVDLGAQDAGASLAGQGTELSELTAEERLANAAADADGALSLVESVVV